MAEYEKLVYPAMEPIVELTTQPGTGRTYLPEFMQGRMFWTGFGVVGIIFTWNIIAWFHPALPKFPTAAGTWVPIGRNFPPQWVFISTVGICFSYFASLELLFSMWLFDLIFIVESGILDQLGITAFNRYYASKRYLWQTTGAFVALSLWWVWIARAHLKEAFQKALHPKSEHIDDSRELISYRAAFCCLAASVAYALVWLSAAGMAWKVLAILLPFMFLSYGAVSKILADSGLIYVKAPSTAWTLTTALMGGARAIPAASHALIYPASVAIDHFRGFTFSVGTHLNRLSDFITGNKRPLFGGLCVAFVVGIVSSTLFTIWLGLSHWRIQFLAKLAHHSRGHRRISKFRQRDHIATADGRDRLLVLSHRSTRHVTPCYSAIPIHLVAPASHWPRPIGHRPRPPHQLHHLCRLAHQIHIITHWRRALLPPLKAVFHRHARGLRPVNRLGLIVDAIWFMPQGHTVHKWY